MNEMIEEVDAQGVPTGRSVARDVAHRDGLWHRTVHIWVVKGGKEVLLQRRAESKENYPGLWDISAAGHISFGETSLEAAEKELFEELGIAAHAEDLSYVTSLAGEAVLNGGRYIDREWADIYLLHREIGLGPLILQEEEVADVRWVSLGELTRRVREGDDTLVPHSKEYQVMLAMLREAGLR
ncbi:NUDIX hydrolase [Desulfoluna limicola]|uniref:NUDIX hydrolase n=1 Tax=Desulfoluna limicola TaxID=2810562 RepID=A0ABN6FDE9_9BACT|nr:NUDIX domain-containing protein [Desulfoluna limicola]BCS99189.1 NUDIX hydrolase [Desulfoluna limicola]